jgi:hypothetical protein
VLGTIEFIACTADVTRVFHQPNVQCHLRWWQKSLRSSSSERAPVWTKHSSRLHSWCRPLVCVASPAARRFENVAKMVWFTTAYCRNSVRRSHDEHRVWHNPLCQRCTRPRCSTLLQIDNEAAYLEVRQLLLLPTAAIASDKPSGWQRSYNSAGRVAYSLSTWLL